MGSDDAPGRSAERSRYGGRSLTLPLILPHRMRYETKLASWFGNYYEHLNVVFTNNLNTNDAILVYDGLAVAIVIDGALSLWNQSLITFRELSPSSGMFIAAWKRGQPFSPAAAKSSMRNGQLNT